MNIAWRNILPDYHKAMSDKLVDSLAILEEYGRIWEKQKELDSRYAPPPPPKKMRVRRTPFSVHGESYSRGRYLLITCYILDNVEDEDADVIATSIGKENGGAKSK